MRVKFINRCIGMFRGGGETFDLNMAHNLKNLGVEVTFLTGKPLLKNVKYPIEDFPTDYIGSPYLRDLSQRMPEFVVHGRIYNLDMRLFLHRALNYLKNNNVNRQDIVHVSTFPWFVKLKKQKPDLPMVIRFAGPPLMRDKPLIDQFDAVVANGDAFKVIKEYFRKDVYNVPPGIDLEHFKKTNNYLRERFSINEDFVILFVGRFVPLKNLSFLIKGFSEIIKVRDDVVLILSGEGPLFRRIKMMVQRLGLQNKVVFTGRIDITDLPLYYSMADLFVMTSSYDNFPNAVLEAMSCELPIIATRVGGIPLLIENGVNGFLIKNNDIKDFKEAVICLLGNESLRQKMGIKNRCLVKEKYNWVESAKKVKAIYEKLINSTKANI